MALPTGYEKDLQQCLGSKRVASVLFDALNAAGADDSWNGVNVTATGEITAPSIVAASQFGIGDFAVASAGFVFSSGEYSLYIGADASTNYQLAANAISITEVITAASGEYETHLPANRADAYSITSAGSVDMLVFITTTNALAINCAVALVSTPPANQTLTNSATITLPVGINKVVDNGGAVTGIILTAGLYDGQIINIINAAAASVTFAASGTSNVADGTSAVIAANRAITLIWDLGTSLWYRTG